MSDYDIIIVGAGIAGTSLAYELASYSDDRRNRILILEQEYAPGYHATGRSAAFWSQTYGGPYIEPLTSASGDFLRSPPAYFHDSSFLNNRGAINIARADQKHLADDMIRNFADNPVDLQRMGSKFIGEHLSNIKKDWNQAVWEPECSDIDVAALHAAYIRNAKKLGVEIICSAKLDDAQFADGKWSIMAGDATHSAQLLINAAGAWADQTASIANITPIGITPFRRTMVELELIERAYTDLPLIVALDGSFYFKAQPDGKVWISPHDEIASAACDAAPEEIDIAIAIDRFQSIVNWDIVRITNKWAGLRSFSKDRLPVIGYDRGNKHFFWFVGQGGFGIQTAPAAAKIAAHKVMQASLPKYLSHIDDSKYVPDRFS